MASLPLLASPFGQSAKEILQLAPIDSSLGGGPDHSRPDLGVYSAAVFSEEISSGFESFSLKSHPALYGSVFTRAGLLSSSELISTTSPLTGE